MEEFRLQYPLSESSLVLDAGAYHGDFISWCRDRWRCDVYAFEPTKVFYENVVRRFVDDTHVRVFHYGIGACTETVPIAIKGDATSAYFDSHQSGNIETVQLKDVVEVFAGLGALEADLFKINIEGGEYSRLKRMLDTGLVARVRYFQVQYHGIGAGPEGPAVARGRIRARLSETHKEEWCVNGGQWESWARR